MANKQAATKKKTTKKKTTKKRTTKKRTTKTQRYPFIPIVVSQDAWNTILTVVHLKGRFYYKDGNC